MAKETKNKNAETSKEGLMKSVTDENILEQIKNANKYSEEIVKLADNIKDEKEKERMARELNEIRDKASYINLKSVLRSRLVNKHKRATDAARVASLDLLQKVTGGEMTAVEYDKAVEEAIVESNKKIDEARKEYDEGVKELKNQFPASWCWDWDDPFRRLKNIDRQ